MQKIWQHVGDKFAYRAHVDQGDAGPTIILERLVLGESWTPCPAIEFCAPGLLWIKQLADAANMIVRRVTADVSDEDAPPTDREPWSEPHDDGGLAAAFRAIDMGAITDGRDADVFTAAPSPP